MSLSLIGACMIVTDNLQLLLLLLYYKMFMCVVFLPLHVYAVD